MTIEFTEPNTNWAFCILAFNSTVKINMSKKVKSIYGLVKKLPEAQALPVFIHGEKLSQELHGACQRITNTRLARVQLTIDTIKLSAAHSGSYSLSANQIGISNSIFVIHKKLQDNVWLHDET